ncbi:Predicted arabinose efflux permease, MFS family [Bacillus sp. OV166]|uniref:MFS transporter n=1 Tax=unclassified Bacillus (in: firmicutes) TaxID=185979 RepID=UPI000A2AB9ED|nr:MULTISPECIES: MFS transporter [unclassified Bacillus (in: firmicutes)]PGY10726.1 MFS transporter [Bacillus sp. AFS031507]SMQ71981.1 Predicted arabinose efflux permease, MFS family [Bacillus sp. OV166]
MAVKTISRNFLKFLVVILAFQDVAAGVAGSIMADIIKAFPQYDPTIVMLVATFPGLIQIVPALFYGKLSKMFKKRTLLFVGLSLFIIGGVLPTFIDNLWLIIAMRGILGLGVGITMPLSVDVITDFFDGRERDFLIGFGTSTIACIGAIFFQLVGGILADAYGWHYGFLTYLFPIWILAITILYLPEPEKKQVAIVDSKQAAVKIKLPKAIYWVSLGQVFYSALIFGYVVNISVVIQADKLGNATEAGLAISIFTFGTLIAGFLFGKIKHKLPTMYLPLAVLMTGVGMAICYYSPTLTMILIGSVFGGFAMGIGIPGVFTRVSELTPVGAPSNVGLVVAGQGIGGILGPFGFQVIQNIFNQDIGRFPLAVSAIGLVALAIIWAISVMKPKRDIEATLSQ